MSGEEAILRGIPPADVVRYGELACMTPPPTPPSQRWSAGDEWRGDTCGTATSTGRGCETAGAGLAG